MKDTKEKRQKALKELTEQLEQSIRGFMDGDRYKEFLGKMARFHSYSLNNQILIAVQKPEATLCASYTTWKKMGRYVKKGEKGIRILCPSPYKVQALENEKDPETGKDRLMKDGKPYQKRVEVVVPAYKVGYTYDISHPRGPGRVCGVYCMSVFWNRYIGVFLWIYQWMEFQTGRSRTEDESGHHPDNCK